MVPGALGAVAVNDEGSEMYGWRAPYRAQTFDRRSVPSGAILASTDLPTRAEVARDPRTGQLRGLALGPRPPRVVDLAATVSGATVTSSWTTAASRALATHVIVEAGSAPGLRNLARLVVPAGAATLTVNAVPRGSYFVRIRAANGTGEGVATGDIRVDVS